MDIPIGPFVYPGPCMFQSALEQLVSETGAELAIFCDYDGEAIAFASKGLEDFDVRVAGAQLWPVLFTVQELSKDRGESERISVSCATDRRTLLLEGLPGRYYLVLSLPPRALEPLARYKARAVAALFEKEL